MSPQKGLIPGRITSWLIPVALTVTGVSLLVSAGWVLRTANAAPPDLGTVPATAGPVAGSAGAPGPVSRPAGSTRRDPAASSQPGSAKSAPVHTVRPVSVRLPAGTPAEVVPVSVDPAGALNPPSQVHDIGWWRGGAAMGSPSGTLVLVGHVDAARQGIGTFAALRRTRPGQTVQLRGQDGRVTSYRITGLRTYSRAKPLPASVFSSRVAARLVLITCTGTFNQRTGHYSDSLVVYAVPA